MRRSIRVLVVEDTHDDAELMILALQEGGFDPIWERVDTAEAFETALAAGPWDAILSDYTLPKFGATVALKIVRATDPSVPFLVVSGTIGEEVAVAMMRAGANDYVLKQNLTRLAAALDRELRETDNRRAWKRADAELRASETRYRRLFEAAQDGILIVDAVSRQILDANPFLTKLLGYERKELVGKELWQIGLFRDIEANQAAFRTLQERGYIRYDSQPLSTKDGHPIEVEFVSNFYDAGDARVVQCNIRDITEQKRAAESLKALAQQTAGRERMFSAMLSSIHDFAFFLDREGRFLFANQPLLDLWGITLEEVVGKSFFDLGYPDELARRFQLQVQEVFGTKTSIKDDSPITSPAGLKGYFEYILAPVFATDGTVEFVVGSTREITERKQAEEALRQSHKRLRDLIDGLGPSMFVGLLTPDGVLIDVNQPPLVAAGLKPEDVLGQPFEKTPWWARLPDDQRHLREAIVRAARGESSRFDMRVQGVDDQIIDIDFSLQPLRNETGAVVFLIPSAVVITERKQAEEALRASEAEFRTLVQAVPEIVWITRPDGWTIYVNQQWMDYTGLTYEESLGQGWTKPFHPEDQQRAFLTWKTAVATSSPYTVESRIRRTDGVYRWWLVRGVPLRDATGTILKWFGTCTDIDELKQAVLERDKVLALLQLHIERIPLACILFNADFCITDWNPAAERIFGYTKEEVLGLSSFELIAQSFRQQGIDLLARIRAGDMAANSVNENLTKEGRTITCEWFNTPLTSEDGQFVGMLCLAQDITARRDAEVALRLRDRAIQAVTQGILITDPCQPDNPIIFASPGFHRLTGYSLDEVMGRNCRFLQGKDTNPEAVAQIRVATQEGRACTVELQNYRKDGTPFWNGLSISPVLDAAGKVTHFVGVQTDVTARRHLEEQFRQAQKMDAFGQLAGGVAHDFNNLLTIINGYSDIVFSSLAPDDKLRGFVTEIIKAGERSAALTRQLLAFSRKQVIVLQILDLNTIVGNTEKMLRRVIGEDIKLVTLLSPDTGAVRADAGQIEQILLNLAVNARDAMPQGGNLTIETTCIELDEHYTKLHINGRTGVFVQLTVSDSGCGMTDDVKARMFEPFFTTKGLGKGTGLGLATVYGIVKQAEGHIEVYSEVNVGTSFKVYLPRVNRAVKGTGETDQLNLIPHGTESILLVEDEAGLRGLLLQVLTDCGYAVVAAGSGVEAIRLAQEKRSAFDLIVTDVVMPGMSGRQMVEQLVVFYPKVKVLYMSGYTDDAVIRHGILHERVPYLQKPFSPGVFARKVRDLLDS